MDSALQVKGFEMSKYPDLHTQIALSFIRVIKIPQLLSPKRSRTFNDISPHYLAQRGVHSFRSQLRYMWSHKMMTGNNRRKKHIMMAEKRKKKKNSSNYSSNNQIAECHGSMRLPHHRHQKTDASDQKIIKLKRSVTRD